MFAIAFDMVVPDLAKVHPKGISTAYSDIAKTLMPYGFERIQSSGYVTHNDDLANLFDAITALKALRWFRISARDIRGFKVENWSDFTASLRRRVEM